MKEEGFFPLRLGVEHLPRHQAGLQKALGFGLPLMEVPGRNDYRKPIRDQRLHTSLQLHRRLRGPEGLCWPVCSREVHHHEGHFWSSQYTLPDQCLQKLMSYSRWE